jgi:hypothetical protein
MKLVRQVIILFIFIIFVFAQNDSIPEDNLNEKNYVYVLHGLGRGKSAVKLLALRLEEAGFQVERIGYKSINRSPQEILHSVTVQINSSLPDSDYTVHFVGHSLGGLMIRAYLDSNRVKNLGHVVLIGTPNQGTPFVDKYRDSWWMKLLGPMPLALGTDENSFPNSIASPYYPVGIIAGTTEIINNEKVIPGKDDGIVPLESTKLEQMTDIIILKTNHAMLPKSRKVANQTINFLQHGKFIKSDLEH